MCVEFSDITYGQIFLYYQMQFVRCDAYDADGFVVNAVCLKDGTVWYLADDEIVEIEVRK